MIRSLFILLVSLLAVSNAYKYIASIEVDGPSGQIYVGENQDSKIILYELDNAKVKQNAVHYLPGAELETGSFFVAKRSNNRVLYTVATDAAGAADLSFFRVPIGNADTLSAQRSAQVGSLGLSLEPTYNTQDNRAILAVSRNLTLVNLQNLHVLDSFRYYTYTRSFGHNLVYNPHNNHLISFYTNAPIGAPYGLSVNEFDLSNNNFAQVPTTYDCECHTDPENSPFYHAVLGNCKLDNSVSPARIWCVDPDQSKFFNFKANNLSNFEIFTSTASFQAVAWDFANNVAYAINANAYSFDATSDTGFQVYKINLNNNHVEKAFDNPTINVDPYTFKLDPEEPHIYISVANTDDSQPTQIVYVNTNNLSTYAVVTLDSSSL